MFVVLWVLFYSTTELFKICQAVAVEGTQWAVKESMAVWLDCSLALLDKL